MIKHETDCKVHVVIKTFDNARLEANLLTGKLEWTFFLLLTRICIYKIQSEIIYIVLKDITNTVSFLHFFLGVQFIWKALTEFRFGNILIT